MFWATRSLGDSYLLSQMEKLNFWEEMCYFKDALMILEKGMGEILLVSLSFLSPAAKLLAIACPCGVESAVSGARDCYH